MTQGLGSFVEGLQGGMAARSKRDLNKQYERILADKADVADRDFQNVMDTERDMWAGEHGGSTEGYVAPERTKIQDPALIRLGKFLGGKIKGAFGSGQAQQDASFVSPEIAPSSPVAQQAAGGFQQTGGFQQGQGIPGQQGPMQQPYRDGGLVRGYADGGRVEDDENYDAEVLGGIGGAGAAYGVGRYGPEIASGLRRAGAGAGRVASGARRLANSKVGKGGAALAAVGAMQGAVESAGTDTDEYRARVEGGIPGFDSRRSGRDTQTVDEAIAAADEQHRGRGTPNPWEAGGGLRDDREAGGEGDWWHWRNAAGFAKDLAGGEAGGDVAARTAGTMMDVGGKMGFGGIPEPSTEDPATTEAVTQAIDAPDTTDSDMAETAMSEGEVAALENPDFAKMAAEGTRPEDLPTMSTQEWADYRSHLFQLEIGRGRSAKEAMQSVEYATVEVQMRGFQRGAQQAAAFLIGGHNEEAALALTNAYQYFPNGSGVRFGSVTDPKTGLPVIMAMGVNEETGEPSGAPMIMTADKLSTLVAQMSDPKAFSAWTKDGHQLQIDVAKMQDQQERTDIYGYNADTARMNARTSAAGAAGGGFSASELRQREAVYREVIGEDMDLVLDQPEHARSLARAMSKLESMYPGIAQNDVIDEVYRAYDLDKENMSGIEALINPQAQQTGIPEG